MVLAAGLGTRLRPLTYELPKPMVPVLHWPVMGHIVRLLERQGFDELVANIHHFPDALRGYFGDRLEWIYEEQLLGTAGSVRNARDFFGDEPIVVVSGDALTDLDVNALVERHREAGGIATLTVKQVPDTSQFGVVVHDDEGRVQGFQEKPDPDEALSDLSNCGIYCFNQDVFDYFPDGEVECVDWASDVFPVLLDNDVPFYIHETEGYWNDIGSVDELQQATFHVLEGQTGLEVPGRPVKEGAHVGEGTDTGGVAQMDTPVWIGERCQLGRDLRLMGPVAIGDDCRIGEGASLRDAIVLPGTELADGEILVGGIAGREGIVEKLRPLDR